MMTAEFAARHRYNIDGKTRSGGRCPSMKVLMLMMTFSPMSTRPNSLKSFRKVPLIRFSPYFCLFSLANIWRIV